MNKTVSNFLIGFLAGAAAGAIAGILLAPGKGSETRKNLKNTIRDFSDDFGLGISELIDEFDSEPEPAPRPKRKRTNDQEPMTKNQ
jgi:hypothetical protein